MGGDRPLAAPRTKAEYSRHIIACSLAAALSHKPMFETWGSYIALTIILVFACFWAFRPRPDFKAPETKAFDKQIFKYFIKRKSLFVNKTELTLYGILSSELTPRYHVFSKVRLEDIIGVNRAGLSPKSVWSLRGRVKSRHVDFLITTPRGIPLMIIELDGSSHNSKAAQRPDDLKDGLADAVGLSLRRVRVGDDFQRFVTKIKTELAPY